MAGTKRSPLHKERPLARIPLRSLLAKNLLRHCKSQPLKALSPNFPFPRLPTNRRKLHKPHKKKNRPKPAATSPGLNLQAPRSLSLLLLPKRNGSQRSLTLRRTRRSNAPRRLGRARDPEQMAKRKSRRGATRMRLSKWMPLAPKSPLPSLMISSLPPTFQSLLLAASSAFIRLQISRKPDCSVIRCRRGS